MPVQELLADKEVILAAVQQDGLLLERASKELRREPGVRLPERDSKVSTQGPSEKSHAWQPGSASSINHWLGEQDFGQ